MPATITTATTANRINRVWSIVGSSLAEVSIKGETNEALGKVQARLASSLLARRAGGYDFSTEDQCPLSHPNLPSDIVPLRTFGDDATSKLMKERLIERQRIHRGSDALKVPYR